MHVQPECVPCLLKRVHYETNLVNGDKAYETLKGALEVMSGGFGENVNSAELATEVHARAYKILENKDPYAEMKERSNIEALKLYPRAERLVDESNDRFASAVLCSIIGNVLDFGIGSPVNDPEEFSKKFGVLYDDGLGHDDTGRIKELLSKSSDDLFFSDNAGEIVFDQLLIKELKEFDVRITLVVRGEPILTDATMDDVRNFGLDKQVDEVETTNAFAVGVNFGKITPNLGEKLKETDLIISKGMANWESFSDEDYRPIAYILRTKCGPVARGLGVEKDLNVVKLYE